MHAVPATVLKRWADKWLRSSGAGAPTKFLPVSRAKHLAGKRVLITRPARQAQRICALVEAAGGEPLRYPTLTIAPPTDPQAASLLFQKLETFDIAIFVSPTAVQEGLALLGRAWPGGVQAAAVGPGTRMELELRGVGPVLGPVSGADSGALLAIPALADVRGQRVLIIRGTGGRAVLGDVLAGRGATVEYAECYRRLRSEVDLAPLVEHWKRGRVHASTFFSAGALDNLLERLPPDIRDVALHTPLFASHPRIGEVASAKGAHVVRVAGPADDDMLRGLIAFFSTARPNDAQ